MDPTLGAFGDKIALNLGEGAKQGDHSSHSAFYSRFIILA